jgi:hypothetical protein
MKKLEDGLYEFGDFLIERNNYYGGATGEALKVCWEVQNSKGWAVRDLDAFPTLRAAKKYILNYGHELK